MEGIDQMIDNIRQFRWVETLGVVLLVGILAIACDPWATPGYALNSTPLPAGSGGIIPTPQTGQTSTVVDAPVESIEIERLAAKPPNATMIVVSALPSGCESFNGYSLTREGDVFNLVVTNLRPDMDCPATYTTVRTDIPLGQPVYSKIEPCRIYTVVVNGETRHVESSCPALDSGLWTTDGPTSTPRPVREWDLEDIQVNDSTVTVLLHVYAGIDVRATLDGREPEEVKPALPSLEFVFENVTPGKHAVEVWDVVGHKETMEVVVPRSTARLYENSEEVTFDQLLSDPGQYNGKDIILTGFYFHGAETIVLSERLEPTGFSEGHLWPRGRMVWIEPTLQTGYDRPT